MVVLPDLRDHLLKAKQNVETNGLELFGQEDLCKTTGFFFSHRMTQKLLNVNPLAVGHACFCLTLCFLSLQIVES